MKRCGKEGKMEEWEMKRRNETGQERTRGKVRKSRRDVKINQERHEKGGEGK